MAEQQGSQVKALSSIALGVVGAVFIGIVVQNEEGVPIAEAIAQKFKGTTAVVQKITPALETPMALLEKILPDEKVSNEETQKASKQEGSSSQANNETSQTENSSKDTLNEVVENVTSGAEKLAKQFLDKVDETVSQIANDKASEDQAAKEQEIASLDLKEKNENKQTKDEFEIGTQSANPVLPQATKQIPHGTPSIDLLRVEPNGSVVIAGNTKPNTNVRIFDGEKLVAEGKSTISGEYVIVFDEPLQKGDHELIVKSGDTKETQMSSLASGVVILPENPDEMIVLLSTPGEASKILQMPTSRFDANVQAEKNQNTTITRVKEAQETKEELETPSSSLPVLVNAVDVEQNAYYVAGAATPGSTVNIYIENEFKGRAITGLEGAFLFYDKDQIKPGRYALRVDMLDASGSKVVSRAEVTLEHEIEKVEIASLEAASDKSIKQNMPNDSNAQIKVSKDAPAKIGEAMQVEVSKNTSKQPMEILKEEMAKQESVEENAASEKLAIQSKGQARSNPSDLMAGKAEASTSKIIKSGSSVIIRRGDNLWRISRRVLGAGRKYTLIYEANQTQIQDPHRIYPGQVFDVPEQASNPSTSSVQ